MNIAICDDNKIFVEDTLAKLKALLPGDSVYTVFYTGDELLQSKEEFDCIFLDIEMPGVDGIEVKNLLEMRKQKTKVIFLTNYVERMREAFGTGVIGFLTKPVDNAELKIIVEKIIQSTRHQYIEFDLGQKHFVVDLTDILFIEAEDKYTYIHTRKGDRYCVRKTMKEWEEELPRSLFCRINRSIFVHYELFDANLSKVLLPNGKLAVVSRMQRDVVRKGYTEYLLSK